MVDGGNMTIEERIDQVSNLMKIVPGVSRRNLDREDQSH